MTRHLPLLLRRSNTHSERNVSFYCRGHSAHTLRLSRLIANTYVLPHATAVGRGSEVTFSALHIEVGLPSIRLPMSETVRLNTIPHSWFCGCFGEGEVWT